MPPSRCTGNSLPWPGGHGNGLHLAKGQLPSTFFATRAAAFGPTAKPDDRGGRFLASTRRALLSSTGQPLCGFYGASGEEIISIGADVPNDGAPSSHGSVRKIVAIPTISNEDAKRPHHERESPRNVSAGMVAQ
jgi:hypothetical protein